MYNKPHTTTVNVVYLKDKHYGNNQCNHNNDTAEWNNTGMRNDVLRNNRVDNKGRISIGKTRSREISPWTIIIVEELQQGTVTTSGHTSCLTTQIISSTDINRVDGSSGSWQSWRWRNLNPILIVGLQVHQLVGNWTRNINVTRVITNAGDETRTQLVGTSDSIPSGGTDEQLADQIAWNWTRSEVEWTTHVQFIGTEQVWIVINGTNWCIWTSNIAPLRLGWVVILQVGRWAQITSDPELLGGWSDTKVLLCQCIDNSWVVGHAVSSQNIPWLWWVIVLGQVGGNRTRWSSQLESTTDIDVAWWGSAEWVWKVVAINGEGIDLGTWCKVGGVQSTQGLPSGGSVTQDGSWTSGYSTDAGEGTSNVNVTSNVGSNNVDRTVGTCCCWWWWYNQVNTCVGGDTMRSRWRVFVDDKFDRTDTKMLFVHESCVQCWETEMMLETMLGAGNE